VTISPSKAARAASHRHRFPTVRTLADRRRARQPAVREGPRFKPLDSDAWIDVTRKPAAGSAV